MYTLGQYDGRWDDTPRCINALHILDFGQPTYNSAYSGSYGGYGTNHWLLGGGKTWISDANIAIATENYVSGWWSVTGSCPYLNIAIGDNNSYECPNGSPCDVGTAGTQWGNMIYAVHMWLVTKGYTGQVSVWAADDIEQGSGYDCYSTTTKFVDKFILEIGFWKKG
jgi:hypothetical protein